MGGGFPFLGLKSRGRAIQAQSQMKLSFGGYIKDGNEYICISMNTHTYITVFVNET